MFYYLCHRLMIPPTIPENEEQRLASLNSYSLLDTLPEKEYNDIVRIAANICKTPISAISLVDKERVWYKASFGDDESELPREVDFCSYTIVENEHLMMVPDLRRDHRFDGNPLVSGEPHYIFYAGVKLESDTGHAIGAICVLDKKPRKLTPSQTDALISLANQVQKLLELRKKTLELDALNELLETKNQSLERFAYLVAHDLKSPLAHIISASDETMLNRKENSEEFVGELMKIIHKSGIKLHNFVTDILEYSIDNNLLINNKTTFDLKDFFVSLLQTNSIDNTVKITYPQKGTVDTHRVALEQIFMNLISNAVKHNDKEEIEIDINFEEKAHAYSFTVTDNGPGIDQRSIKKIFNLFETKSKNDGHYGIGLATVSRLVNSLKGDIKVSSSHSEGAQFEFTIGK